MNAGLRYTLLTGLVVLVAGLIGWLMDVDSNAPQSHESSGLLTTPAAWNDAVAAEAAEGPMAREQVGFADDLVSIRGVVTNRVGQPLRCELVLAIGGAAGEWREASGEFHFAVSRSALQDDPGVGVEIRAPMHVARVVAVHAATPDQDSIDLGRIVLEPGGSIAGILTIQGRPLECEAVVDLFAMGSSDGPMRSARIGDGEFTFQHLAPDRYWVEVVAQQGVPAMAIADLVRSSESTLRLDLDPGRVVRGRVLDSLGRPVHGAVVTLAVDEDASARESIARTGLSANAKLRIQQSARGYRRILRRATSQADGSFVVSGVPALVCSLRAAGAAGEEAMVRVPVDADRAELRFARD